MPVPEFVEKTGRVRGTKSEAEPTEGSPEEVSPPEFLGERPSVSADSGPRKRSEAMWERESDRGISRGNADSKIHWKEALTVHILGSF